MAKHPRKALKGKVLVIDGSNLLHRIAFVKSLRELTNGMIFGFMKSLATLASGANERASAIVCWDKGTPIRCGLARGCYKNWKTDPEILPEEKRKFLDEYRRSRLAVHELLLTMGIPSIMLDGFEADDLAYYMIHRLNHNNIIVVSEDRDLLQLVNPRVRLHRPLARDTWDVAKLRDKYSLSEKTPIEEYLLLKSLTGDKSDGIPGIRGIGDKTAIGVIERLAAGSWEPQGAREEEILLQRKIVERNLALVDISNVVLRNLKKIRLADAAVHSLHLDAQKRRMALVETIKRYDMKTLLGYVGELMSLSVSVGTDDLVLKPDWPKLRFHTFKERGLNLKYRWAGLPQRKGH